MLKSQKAWNELEDNASIFFPIKYLNEIGETRPCEKKFADAKHRLLQSICMK